MFYENTIAWLSICNRLGEFLNNNPYLNTYKLKREVSGRSKYAHKPG